MDRVSAHQRKVLAAGDIVRWFDVYGGYWWTFGQEPVREVTIDALLLHGWILSGKNERVFSGRQRMPYSVTAEGRAILKVSPHSMIPDDLSTTGEPKLDNSLTDPSTIGWPK